MTSERHVKIGNIQQGVGYVFLSIMASSIIIAATVFSAAMVDVIFPDGKKEIIAAVLGGMIGGAMTIYAGWLAFKEARRSNQENIRVQTMNLLIEHMKAVNIVYDEIGNVHKKCHEINMTTINNIRVTEALNHPIAPQTDKIKIVAEKLRERIPRLIQISVPALANACVILPIEVPKMVGVLNEAINDVQEAYLQVLPGGREYFPEDLVWRNALHAVFAPTGSSPSKLNLLIACTLEALNDLDKLRVKYAEQYAKITAHYVNAQ